MVHHMDGKYLGDIRNMVGVIPGASFAIDSQDTYVIPIIKEIVLKIAIEHVSTTKLHSIENKYI